MACSGCDARRAWIKRKAKLAAQALAALVRQEPKPEPKQPDGQPLSPRTDNPAQ